MADKTKPVAEKPVPQDGVKRLLGLFTDARHNSPVLARAKQMDPRYWSVINNALIDFSQGKAMRSFTTDDPEIFQIPLQIQKSNYWIYYMVDATDNLVALNFGGKKVGKGQEADFADAVKRKTEYKDRLAAKFLSVQSLEGRAAFFEDDISRMKNIADATSQMEFTFHVMNNALGLNIPRNEISKRSREVAKFVLMSNHNIDVEGLNEWLDQFDIQAIDTDMIPADYLFMNEVMMKTEIQALENTLAGFRARHGGDEAVEERVATLDGEILNPLL